MTIAAPSFGNKKRSFKTTFEIVIEPKLNFCVLKEKWEMNSIKLSAWNQMMRRNSAATETDFCLSKKDPQTANWDDGANLRQWFKRILFNEMSVASAPRKRGVRSSATTSPPDAFIIT